MIKQIRLPAILILGVFAVFWACSKNSTNNNLTEGDYYSQDYQLAKEDVDTTVTDFQIDDAEVAGWLSWYPGLATTDSVVYDSTSGWHTRIRAFDGNNYQASVIDSFRFVDLSGAYQIHRDSTTNGFERRLKRSYTLSNGGDTSGTHWIRTYQRNANWIGLADTVATLSATFSRTWTGQTERRDFSRNVQGALNDIKYYTADFGQGHRPYPISGTANGSVVLDIVTPTGQVHLEGTLTITFRMENGQHCYYARLVRGSNWWEWDHCFTD